MTAPRPAPTADAPLRLTPDHLAGIDLAVAAALKAGHRRIKASDGTVIVLPGSVEVVMDALYRLQDAARAAQETTDAE